MCVFIAVGTSNAHCTVTLPQWPRFKSLVTHGGDRRNCYAKDFRQHTALTIVCVHGLERFPQPYPDMVTQTISVGHPAPEKGAKISPRTNDKCDVQSRFPPR